MKPSRALLALLAALLSAAILLGALPALGLPLPASLTPLWWGLLLTLLLACPLYTSYAADAKARVSFAGRGPLHTQTSAN